ncbi:MULTISPECIES: hypothetical protein [unclassified Nostoc]|uniref:WD40 repeat domain-containing protein n=1 Tax=unclassified Nostoc TaxID=2593658 RepID=UPI0025E71F03|nr:MULTISPECIES: hypothetical protein [unclassified Nostoc]MBN3892082.1 PD40 domain-containing protein [Nostoc sp. JL31]
MKLWNLKGEEIITLQHGRFTNVLFSPDGKTIATVSMISNTAKLWNLQGGLIATLTHDSWVNDISFSPDGKIIVTASSDKTSNYGIWKDKKLPLSSIIKKPMEYLALMVRLLPLIH